MAWELWLIKICFIGPAGTECLDILFFHSYSFCLGCLVKHIHTISLDWAMDWVMTFNVNIMYVVILFALHVLFKQNIEICLIPMCPVFFSNWCYSEIRRTWWCLSGLKSPKRSCASTCLLSNWFCSNHKKKKALANGLLSIALIIH